MIEIADKTKCCGCTACASICPRHCIQMCSDEEGFVYPKVNKDACISCNLCTRSCPILHQPIAREISRGYVARNNDSVILARSSSGGFFDAICRMVIDQGGIVVGAAFSDDYSVHHIIAETIEACSGMYGSKYVQSDLHDVFGRVRDQLLKGRLVCFSGTPCQVAGLVQFLNREYENLITIDLVCHGVPSPTLWDEYRTIMEDRFASKITDVNFRSKQYGYQSSTMRIEFENHRVYLRSPATDLMLKGFYGNLNLRPSCYACAFKGTARPADFTVYDCWHSAAILGKQDDDLGYTSILVRGEKADRIIGEIQPYLTIYECEVDKIIPLHGGMLTHSARRHKYRDIYYTRVHEVGMERAIDELMPISSKAIVMEHMKPMLQKMGVLHRISRMKKVLKKHMEKPE